MGKSPWLHDKNISITRNKLFQYDNSIFSHDIEVAEVLCRRSHEKLDFDETL
jgi:hypothetical protein